MVDVAPREERIAPVWAEVRERWPLDAEHKALLANFATLQLLRGQRWRSHRGGLVDETVREKVAGRAARRDGPSAPDLRRDAELLNGPLLASLDMLERSVKLATALAAMRWTLLEADGPQFVTSDEPVVCWPLGQNRVGTPPVRVAPVGSLEVRFPLTPHLALLATWDEGPDVREPVAATRHVVRVVNTLTEAAASKQVMHRSDTVPLPRLRRAARPVSSGLPGRYDRAVAEASPERAFAADHLVSTRNEGLLGCIRVIDRDRSETVSVSAAD